MDTSLARLASDDTDIAGDRLAVLYPMPPISPASAPPEVRREQVRLRNVIVQAGSQLTLPEWGGYGDIIGTVRVVELARLWIHPAHPIIYSETELEQAAVQLATEGQLAPLKVQAALDPSVPHAANRPQIHDLMLVDADSIKVFLAAPRRAVDRLTVVVGRYTNLYEATKALALPLFSQHTLTEAEEDMLLASLRLSYNLARRLNPDMPRFPTQEEWGALLNRDQTTISRRMAVGNLPDDVLLALMARRLTVAQAKEMLPLPEPQIRELTATLIAENMRSGRPVTQKETRARVKSLRNASSSPEHETPTWQGRTVALPENLWLGDALDGLSMAAVVSRLGQDLERCLAAIYQVAPRHDAGITTLLRALHHPSVQALIGTPQATPASEGSEDEEDD